MKFYTVSEVADILRLPADWDRERWVRARCKDGRIKAKCISRGVYRISEEWLAEFLEPDVSEAAELHSTEQQQTDEPRPVSSIADGISARVRRGRMRSA